MSGWVCPGSAGLRKPYSGQGSLRPAVAVADFSGRRARIPAPLRARPPAARGQGVPGDRARRAGSCKVPGANSDVAPSTLALLSAAAAPGTAGWGVWGRRSESPVRGWGRGSAGARGEGGRRARGWVGWDDQHLGQNSSRWFPPSLSQDSEMGPCEAEGGSERRVCVRARTGRRGKLFPPAKETR